MAGVYASKRANPTNAIRGIKQLHDSDSDVTESEPELEIQQKEVDKMDQIPEENDEDKLIMDDEKSPNNDNNNKNKKKSKKKKKKRKDDEKKDDDDLSDSEEYSMQRMVEEYQKSRTMAKKFAEIIEDISETFKRKSIEIRRKFEAEPPPAVIKPMSLAEQVAKLNQNSVPKNNKKQKKKKDIEDKNKKENDNDFEDEKEKQMEDMDKEEQEQEKDKEVDMVDSEDEFGDFGANNFEEFGDFENDKIDDNNGAVEIVVNNNKENLEIEDNENEDKRDLKDDGDISIAIEDEKVKENVNEIGNEDVGLMKEENVNVNLAEN